MNEGILYGVGVGPGEPELLTLKAVRILREADVVALPNKGSGEQTALQIVKEHVADKPLLLCHTPMVRDAALLEQCYTKAADQLCALLQEGKKVAFITLGDPTIYSTYVYIHRKVLERGYQAELIPGVPSFCAAAARLGVSLCQGEERLLIVPASHDIEDCLNISANQVYMKAGRRLDELRHTLSAHGKVGKAMAVSNCGMADERVWSNLEEMESNSRYFSIVFVPEKSVE